MGLGQPAFGVSGRARGIRQTRYVGLNMTQGRLSDIVSREVVIAGKIRLRAISDSLKTHSLLECYSAFDRRG
jgi:hypothetical protein